jgi:hypothetical protein
MENDELGRAIEAVLLVAVEPGAPGLLAELVEEPVERVEEAWGPGRRATRPRAGASSWPASPVAPAADPSRPGPLRGALRQPRRLAPPLDRRAGDAGHRRLPPAGVPGQISSLRGVNVDGVTGCSSSGATSRWSAGPTARAAALFGTTDLFLERWASTRWSSCRRWRTSSPGPRWPGPRARPAVGWASGSSGVGPTTSDDDLTRAEGSACRRSWPGPGRAPGGPARS